MLLYIVVRINVEGPQCLQLHSDKVGAFPEASSFIVLGVSSTKRCSLTRIAWDTLLPALLNR